MRDAGTIALVEGTVIADKYRLERPLARGGMGSVWVARHIALDEPVAIKLIAISGDDLGDAEVRFQREARSVARLRSPHVVQLLDYGTDRGVPYIVMELLDGEHLGERIRRKGRLSLALTAAICEQMAKALRRAHKEGIVHRDLKPANVFLSRVDDEETVKLLDFGIVKAVRGTLTGKPTQANLIIGSPNYMSPEQTAGAQDLDFRADLWSLGAILFEAITGHMAFPGDSLINVILHIRGGPLPVPTLVAPDLPAEIDAFFQRAFERDREKRFPSARAMAAELTAIVKRLGPRARHVSPALSDGEGSSSDATSGVMAATEIFPPSDRHELPGDVAERAAKIPSSVQSIPASPHFSYDSTAPPPVMPDAVAAGGEAVIPRAPAMPKSPRIVAPPSPPPPASPARDPRRAVITRPEPTKPSAPSPPHAVDRKKTLPSELDRSRTKTDRPRARRSEPAPPPRNSAQNPLLRAMSAQPDPAKVCAPIAPPPAPRKPLGSDPEIAKASADVRPPPRPQMDSFSEMVDKGADDSWRSRGRVGELIDKGFTALRRGDRDTAWRCWKEALDLEPTNRTLEVNLRKLESKRRP